MRPRHLSRVVLWCVALGALSAGCRKTPPPSPPGTAPAVAPSGETSATAPPVSPAGPGRPAAATGRRQYRSVHVFVALCDNRHQGIVPVPKALGNGQDAAGNLYWGALYGVKTFFRRSPHWQVVPAGEVAVARDEDASVLETAVFVSAAPGAKTYVLAEAFDGARMDVALRRFFAAAAGRLSRVVVWDRPGGRSVILAGGSADLVCFVGHNGLMDTQLDRLPSRATGARPAGAVVLACKSREYFAAPLARAGCPALITTTGLMAPEAYTLDAIVRSHAAGDPPRTVHLRAAEAYAKYQKCSLAAAKRLFAVGAIPTGR